MKKIIDHIFKSSDHSVKNLEDEFTYYSYQEAAFYFLLEFEQIDFEKIKNYADFANSKNYIQFKKNFDQLEKGGEVNTIERNSSLVVLVKCESLAAIEKYQQQILLLEEDEYFFKKYVIFYSDKAIESLSIDDVEDFLTVLEQMVKDKKQFDLYASKGFQEELEEYLFVLQLFIKLPFLKLSFEGDTFQPLPGKITETLGKPQETLYINLVEKAEDIKNIDLESEESESKIDEILNLLPND